MRASVVPALRRALHAGLITLFPAPVGVILGEPGPFLPDDLVAILGAHSTLTAPVMSPARPREETVTLQVVFSVFRSGTDAQADATDRAFEMHSQMEQWIRSGALEIPAATVVRHLAVTDYELNETPAYGDDNEIVGRVSELRTTLTAQTRI